MSAVVTTFAHMFSHKGKKTITADMLKAAALCAAMACTCAAQGAAAADGGDGARSLADTSYVHDLDEVVVVSQPKDVLSLRRQPLSSSVFTGRDMARLGAGSLAGLSAYAPSFTMPAYGSRLTSSIYVRGIGSRVNNPAVGIYLDGIPLVNKSSYNMHMYQLDRADILRGPQGTLYGINTEGGIVRLYSKSPMRYQGTDISAGIGTRMYRNVELAHYGKISDRTAFSIAAFYNGQNGFFRNSTTGRRADNADEAGGKLRLILRPAPRLTADTTADYQYTSQAAFPYGALDTATGRISSPAGNRPGSYRRNMLNTGAALTYRAGAYTVSSLTSYQLLRDRMEMDQDYLPQDLMHLSQRQLLNALTEELTVKAAGDGPWRHTSGLFASYQWLRTEAPVYFDADFTGRIAAGIQSAVYTAIHTAMADRMAAAGMSPAAAQQAAAAAIEQAGGVEATVKMSVPGLFHTPQLNLALFHETSLSLTPRLTATIGLCYDYSRVALTYATRAAMAVSMSVMGAQATNTLASALSNRCRASYSQLLPKLGLTATIADDGSHIYATASKGYRAGGYNIQMFSDILQAELTANSSAAMAGSYDIPHTADDYARIAKTITYKPEQSWNYELGAHLNLLGGAMQADVAAYYMHVLGQQLSVMAGTYGFGRMMVNACRSRSLGLEAALRGGAAGGRLQWSLAYALTDARFTRYTETADDGTATSYRGRAVPFVPRHTLAARCDLRLPLGTARSCALLLGADMTAQGRTYWDEANTASQPLYALLNLHAGLQRGRTALRLWCRNVTCTRYATFAFSSAAGGSQTWLAQRGAPIQAGVDIRISM